ncbi:hypothetical protein COW36_23610 [bacterium (Candidatus Blackallbacteria) CG17_big_fil_post_rev_8_21_14_2_50_48_46]|uniref:Uncharacterized protein n=1 Tax=bacterium (Candidatus Blackallbacteria) CG17_big_fil_post_rev_8_21_14_2_50_48_46 TaxID=2014261 RepID=A0A2M7FXM3_9BACT|nr:MAG: hypothetical protein COW64_17820 [bacterium (Candidatus Blackallbacteria) CG18_big_fil_WC_8_21_14_2_50_49_26]PIW14024.1 MAG: hypothetical protein COW36_23610 [bacterium (Candidatus Blackallbacteria) CG17_big_fil_post_rev_8_21_14_2_50_48_46]PIW46876.1 MAG: hypothetical protein COW20_14785 [bacterium (Candidatus Blackallbacteria) CG13_big_fil_rev_8_21_14_2_50_49_14]
MLKSRRQGFEVESGENPAPMFVTHWYVLKQALVFALFSVPFLSGLGLFLARLFLRPADQPIGILTKVQGTDTEA